VSPSLRAFVTVALIRYCVCLAVALAVVLVLAALFGPAGRADAGSYHAWTVSYRTAWNAECADALKVGTDMSRKDLYNYCDCVSDILQERWDEKAYEKARHTLAGEDLRYARKAYRACLDQ
jgi:hypothetical protein